MDFDFEVNTKAEFAPPRAWLRRRFYERNRYKTETWSGDRIMAYSSPSALVEYSDMAYDYYYAFYREGYYVRIEQGKSSMHGPHAAKLFIKTPLGDHWLGTTQFAGNFYDETDLKFSLRIALKRREYWSTTQSSEELLLMHMEESITMDTKEDTTVHVRRKGRHYLMVRSGKTVCPQCKKKCGSTRQLRKHVSNTHNKFLLVKYTHTAPWDLTRKR